MRMLTDDSSLAGGVDQGSSSATASPWAWTASQAHAMVKPDGSISTPAFDAHRALILGAVICTLVGAAIGFHCLLGCALHYYGGRRRRRRSAVPTTAGMKQSALRRWPVTLYNEAEAEAEGQGATAAGAECAICLGEFADGDAVRLLPRCRHGFHVHCIDAWLSAHSSCPTCRDSLLDEGVSATAAAAAASEDTTAEWMSSSFVAAMLFLP